MPIAANVQVANLPKIELRINNGADKFALATERRENAKLRDIERRELRATKQSARNGFAN